MLRMFLATTFFVVYSYQHTFHNYQHSFHFYLSLSLIFTIYEYKCINNYTCIKHGTFKRLLNIFKMFKNIYIIIILYQLNDPHDPQRSQTTFSVLLLLLLFFFFYSLNILQGRNLCLIMLSKNVVCPLPKIAFYLPSAVQCSALRVMFLLLFNCNNV